MNRTETGRERTAAVEKRRAGLSVAQIMLVAVLLAAGAVMKFFIGSIFSAGMKPNFIIAMYCLAILLVRPRFKEAAIIGLLAGAVCQFFPGTPYLNFPSEMAGALVMAAFVKISRGEGGFLMPAVSTFITTVASGAVFMALLYALFFSGGATAPAPLAVFAGIIFGTAAVNSVIVQVLYIPISAALKMRVAER
ncbi:MAG: hypothetical protein Q4C86_08295 [bacterium]|nr:hypothetical protein [bacterium]